jgi:hypothetical protein
MRNFKIITFLFIGICSTQLIAQTTNLVATVNHAKDLYVQLCIKENNPLCVVNGIVLKNFENTLTVIKPEDIEKMDVLKGNAAIDKYGDKAINGVINITLKKVANNKYKKLLEDNVLNDDIDKSQYQINISGVISDNKNQTISGVVISNLTKREAYYSDSLGNYKINVAKNDFINFSKSGFNSQKIEVTDQSILDIVLKEPTASDEIMIKKPVIYLYPTVKTDITINVDFKGELLTTFPKYDKNWTVTAYPDGRIFDKKTNRFYASLFWDGNKNFANEHYQYKTGFVVVRNNLTNFLIEKLEFMGLNNIETNEFIQFWLPLLEKNETNFIHFYVNLDYDIISKNNVIPKPDTSIRIFMEFYSLDKTINLPEQILPKTERKGFTLVEWGGCEVTLPLNETMRLKL